MVKITNAFTATVAAGDDGTATQFNNSLKDVQGGIRNSFDDVDDATITFDLDPITGANIHKVVLGGNRILDFANVVQGQHFRVELVQPAVSAGKTVTWWAGISWVNSLAPTLSTTVNKKDSFMFYCTDDTPGSELFDGYIAGLNIG